MSAFVCTDRHVNTLVSFASKHDARYRWRGIYVPIRGREQETASLLHIANVESVNSRYREDARSVGFRFKPAAALSPALHIIKACNCFDYQACEVDNYPDTIAAAIVAAIRDEAGRALPDYDSAPWGLD